MKIIGFMGVSRSGKSTAANMVPDATVIGFGDPIRNMTRELFRTMGFTPKEIEAKVEGDMKDVKNARMFGASPRDLMILIGERFRGDIDERFWIEVARQRMFALYGQGARTIVFNDVRKRIEAEMIKAQGGTVVMITGRGAHAGHSTDDIPEDLADVVIANTGTQADLARIIRERL